MAIIYESRNFVVESHEKPEVDRLEGGHVKISPKVDILDRSQLSTEQAIEIMRLTIVAGIAMKQAMKQAGVDIGRINYQDNGNWNPHFHIHLYGRAIDAKIQKFGDPIISGHKDSYKPLNSDDISRMKESIINLMKSEKYSDSEWGL